MNVMRQNHIAEPQMEQGADGAMYLTQWFERARFEYHPANAAPYTVLLSRLGGELHDTSGR